MIDLLFYPGFWLVLGKYALVVFLAGVFAGSLWWWLSQGEDRHP